LYCNINLQKNRTDGNIYPVNHAEVGKASSKSIDSNATVDFVLFSFGLHDITNPGSVIAQVSPSLRSTTGQLING